MSTLDDENEEALANEIANIKGVVKRAFANGCLNTDGFTYQ